MKTTVVASFIRSFMTAGIVGSALFAGGCQGGSSAPGAVFSADTVSATAQLRVVHASATSSAFDIYADGTDSPLFAGVAFGSASAYVSLPVGTVKLVIRTAGSAANSTPLFVSDPVTLTEGARVTTVAAGLLGTTAATLKFRVQALVEQFAPAAPGQARVRFLNDSYGIAQVGFDLDADGTTESPLLDRFGDSGAEGIAVSARCTKRQLALATGTPAKRLTGFTLPETALTEGAELLVITAGLPTFTPREQRGLQLVIVDASGAKIVKQNPSVYLLNTVADGQPVDLFTYVDPATFIANPRSVQGLAYGKLSSAVQVPPTSWGMVVFLTESGDGGENDVGQILQGKLTEKLEAGERYLLVASGFQHSRQIGGARPYVSLDLYRDGFTTAQSGAGRLRVIQASGGAPALEVGRTPPGVDQFATLDPSFSGLTWKQATAVEGVVAPTAPLNPAVREVGTTAARRFGFSALKSTDRSFAVVAGAWTPAAQDQPLNFVLVNALSSGEWTATPARTN
jgi:hypothetical protein